MPLPWPNLSLTGGDLSNEQRAAIQPLLDQVADRVLALLAIRGLPRSASALFLPWNITTVLDAEKVNAYFFPLTGGTAAVRWFDRSSQIVDPQAVVAQYRNEIGSDASVILSLPRSALEGLSVEAEVEKAAQAHMVDIDRQQRFKGLGDLTGLEHLEPHLQNFLSDHPNPEKNVFIMMRFRETDQFREIHEALRSTLGLRHFDGIRADDRDYTGDLWTNVQLCMTGCTYGIAVFEDIDERDFNPNVSLELGYMIAKGKRCLLLKEQRLTVLPADIIHRLYKPFDSYKISDTVRDQVLRWIDVDLA